MPSARHAELVAVKADAGVNADACRIGAGSGEPIKNLLVVKADACRLRKERGESF